MRLQDKVVLGTTSTLSIGPAIVEKCAQEGARVYMFARNIQQALAIADKLNTADTLVKCVYNDATELESFITMVEAVVQDADHSDVLVSNFGTSNPGKDLAPAHILLHSWML